MTRDRTGTWALAAAAAALVLAFVANHRLPIVRNALIYAKITRVVLDEGWAGVQRAAADPAINCGKSIGFGLFAAPFVRGLGTNVGLAAASCVSTLLFLVACAALYRRFNPRCGGSDRWLAPQLALTVGNPLVVYQAWSAYPDALLAALAVASLLALDALLEPGALRRTRGIAVAYALLLCSAVLVKNAGALLLPAHMAFVLHERACRPGGVGRDRLIAVGTALAIATGFVVAAALGHNRLLRLGSGSGGMSEYLDGLRTPGLLLRNAVACALFLVSSFGLLLRCPRVRWLRDPGRRGALLPFGVVLGALLLFRDSYFNLRYFLLVLPGVVLWAAGGGARTGAGLWAAWAVTNLVLVLNFNAAAVYSAWSRTNLRVRSVHLGRYSPLDSLRMGVHLAQSRRFAALNAVAAPGATVVLVTDYYARYTEDLYRYTLPREILRGDLVLRQCATPARCDWRLDAGREGYCVLGLSTGDRLKLDATRAALARRGIVLRPIAPPAAADEPVLYRYDVPLGAPP